MSKKYTLWGRFGITMDVSKDEAEKLINDTDGAGKEVLLKVLNEGRARFDGESYIPDSVILFFNRESGSDFEDMDIELNTALIQDKAVRPVPHRTQDRGDAR